MAAHLMGTAGLGGKPGQLQVLILSPFGIDHSPPAEGLTFKEPVGKA